MREKRQISLTEEFHVNYVDALLPSTCSINYHLSLLMCTEWKGGKNNLTAGEY